MTIGDRLQGAGPAWIVLGLAALALLAVPVLRRLVPRGRRHRGTGAVLFLATAAALSLTAILIGGMAGASLGTLVQIVSVLVLGVGLVALAGLVLFDLVLARLGVDVPSIVRDLLLVSVAVALVMGFLRLAGLDLFSLVTTSAVLTAVVGLALQSTLANVFGGLGLQLDRTLGYGDWIEVGNRVGRIVEIGWRSTRIVTKDGDTVFVPNSELVAGEVLNFSRPTGTHRLTVRIGFHYRHPPSDVARVLLAAVRGAPGVLDQPPAECGPSDFGESAIIYALRYWIADFARDTVIDEEVRSRLWDAAQRAGLEIPSPIITVISAGGETFSAARRLSGTIPADGGDR